MIFFYKVHHPYSTTHRFIPSKQREGTVKIIMGPPTIGRPKAVYIPMLDYEKMTIDYVSSFQEDNT